MRLAGKFKQPGPKFSIFGSRYEYGRSGNPTRECLEACIASLDGASTTVCFSSGLAATDNVVKSLLAAGDHMVCMDDIYGGTNRLGGAKFNDDDIGPPLKNQLYHTGISGK